MSAKTEPQRNAPGVAGDLPTLRVYLWQQPDGTYLTCPDLQEGLVRPCREGQLVRVLTEDSDTFLARIERIEDFGRGPLAYVRIDFDSWFSVEIAS